MTDQTTAIKERLAAFFGIGGNIQYGACNIDGRYAVVGAGAGLTTVINSETVCELNQKFCMRLSCADQTTAIKEQLRLFWVTSNTVVQF